MSEIKFGRRKGTNTGSRGVSEIDGVNVDHLQSRNLVRIQGVIYVEDGSSEGHSTYNAESIISVPDAPEILEAVARKLLEIAKRQRPALRG